MDLEPIQPAGDPELEIMERQEELGARRSKGAEGLAAAAAAVDGSEAALAEATTDLEVEIARLTGERDEAAAQVPAVLLGRYEELAGQYGGVAVARYVDGRCDGCHIQLSAVARDQLTRAAEDAVVNCEECGRLLVR